MDRTAWIAVTLCVIGLVLWEFYLVKQTPRKPVPVATGPTEASPAPTPSTSPSTTPTAVAPAIAPKAPEAVPSFSEKIESLRSTIPTCLLLCRAWICCSNPPEGLPILHAGGLVHRWKSKRNRCWLVRRKRRISRHKRACRAAFLSGKYRRCGVGCCKRSVFYDVARVSHRQGQRGLGPALRCRARAGSKTTRN